MIKLLLSLFPVFSIVAHADVDAGVAGALAVYDHVKFAPAQCDGRLAEGAVNPDEIRDPDRLRESLAHNPGARVIYGSVDRPYGLVIAVFPGGGPAEPRLTFLLLQSFATPFLGRYQADVGRTVLNLRLERALAKFGFVARGAASPFDRANVGYYDTDDGIANAVMMTQFRLFLDRVDRETMAQVTRELLDWDEKVRLDFCLSP